MRRRRGVQGRVLLGPTPGRACGFRRGRPAPSFDRQRSDAGNAVLQRFRTAVSLSTSTCQPRRRGIQSNSHLRLDAAAASLRVRTRTWQVALQVAPMSIWGRSATLATDRERDVARAVTFSAIRGPARSSGNQVVGSANSPFAILPAAPRSRFCLTGFASMIRAPVAQSTSPWSARICGRRRPRNSSCALLDETLESRVAQRTAKLADANHE